VVRLYHVHDEVCYVVRQADGTPLAVPAWMTTPESAQARIVSAARLPLRVLLELQSTTAASLSKHNVHQEAHDATTAPNKTTTTLRRGARGSSGTAAAEGAGTATPDPDALDAGTGQNAPRGVTPVNKITADHLARRACVYVRQSTPAQVRHNLDLPHMSGR
jgi:hypothetical protein